MTVTVSPDWLIRVADLAVVAGQATMEFYRQDLVVEGKDDGSPLTAADRAAHQIIVQALEHWDPEIPIVSEEGDHPSAAARERWTRFWLVDPLDGTKEFIKRNGEFTVNIALVEHGVPVLGVVYAPALDLLYYAGGGLGSWKRTPGHSPIRLRSRPAAPGHGLRVAESRSHPSAALEAYLATLPVASRVPAGSSLKFCWIAEGKADVYPRLGPTMEWDVAAGDCIFRNSGDPAPRQSPLVYNQPELKNDGFVIGLDTVALPAADPGRVIWLTGLSGSGKTTIAREVAVRLAASGVPVELLDGDAIRALFPTTGFSRPEREEHVRRIGFVASRLEHHGVTVISALVSPYRASRDDVRGLCRRFLEVHVATPLTECERRDVKGLYAKARRGEIRGFTGIDDPYEPPLAPELVLDTSVLTISQSADRVLEALQGLSGEPDQSEDDR